MAQQEQDGLGLGTEAMGLPMGLVGSQGPSQNPTRSKAAGGNGTAPALAPGTSGVANSMGLLAHEMSLPHLAERWLVVAPHGGTSADLLSRRDNEICIPKGWQVCASG